MKTAEVSDPKITAVLAQLLKEEAEVLNRDLFRAKTLDWEFMVQRATELSKGTGHGG